MFILHLPWTHFCAAPSIEFRKEVQYFTSFLHCCAMFITSCKILMSGWNWNTGKRYIQRKFFLTFSYWLVIKTEINDWIFQISLSQINNRGEGFKIILGVSQNGGCMVGDDYWADFFYKGIFLFQIHKDFCSPKRFFYFLQVLVLGFLETVFFLIKKNLVIFVLLKVEIFS